MVISDGIKDKQLLNSNPPLTCPDTIHIHQWYSVSSCPRSDWACVCIEMVW